MGRIGSFVQADNPGAGDAEWVARDRLAHELMYFSRGNPVDLLRRRAGLHRPRRRPGRPADDVRQPGARLPRRRPARHRRHPRAGQLRRRATRCTGRSATSPRSPRQHPALRDGAHQHRYADATAGVYAFSRIDRERAARVRGGAEQQRAGRRPPRSRPTSPSGNFQRVYGDGADRLRSAADRRLTRDRAAAVRRGLRVGRPDPALEGGARGRRWPRRRRPPSPAAGCR